MVEFNNAKKLFIEALNFGAFHRADDGSTSYHYTSLDGFKNIMASGTMYATEYHYLNDEEELKYIEKVMAKVVKKIFSDTHSEKKLNELIKGHLKRLRKDTEDPEKSYYVLCFSKVPDNLTLWAEFARFGCNFLCNPYAIFDSNGIYGSVVYNLREQEELIVEVFQDIFDLFELDVNLAYKDSLSTKLEELNFTELDIMAECIAELLMYYGTLVKRELYAAEQEFRVIIKGEGHEIKYRMKENMIIPYIEISVDKKQWLGNKVTMAPLNHKERCKHSVQAYVDKLGYKDVKVRYSEIHLRF